MKSFYFLLLFSFSLSAQNFQTYRQFGDLGNDKIAEIQALRDGGFIAAGTFSETIDIGSGTFISEGEDDLWIARFNALSEPVWAIGGGSHRDDEITDLKIAPDGTVFLTGAFWQEAVFGDVTLTPGLSGKSFFVLKMNPEGVVLNSTVISGKGVKEINETAVDSLSNVFLTGNFSDTLVLADTFFVSNYEGNFFAAKMNADFELSQFEQPTGDGFSNGNALCILPSGEIVAAGEFMGNIYLKNDSISTVSADEDVFFAKFSSDVEPIFLQKAGGVLPAFCKKAVSDTAGNFYLSGHHRGVINLDDDLQIRTQGRDDNFFILAYRGNGSAIWGKSYGSNENSEMTDLQILDNQLFISGFFDGDMEIESKTIPLGDGFFNAFFAGFSKRNGNLNWIITPKGNDAVSGKCITPISPEEAVVGLDFSDEIIFDNDRFLSTGLFDFFTSKLETPAPVAVNDRNDFEFSIYPNPAENFIFLNTDLRNFQSEIFTVEGQKAAVFSNQKKLDLSFLPKGFYFLKIIDSNGNFSFRKFFKN